MKRAWIILIFGVLVGLASYSVFTSTRSRNGDAKNASPELAWMKTEFQLSNAEFTQVCLMHTEYTPHCREMCARIDAKNAELQKLFALTNRVTPEIEQALQDVAKFRAECQAMMLQHFYRVSAAMPPEQGKRYLAWVQRETLFTTNRSAMLQ